MVYLWKSVECYIYNSPRHKFTLHYHLGKNDVDSFIKELKDGADPLKINDHGDDAISLALKFFIKHLNKCLMTPSPLGLQFKRRATETCQVDLLSEYHDLFKEISQSVTDFFEKPRDEELILGVHGRLLKKTKGFLSILKAICENPDYRNETRKRLNSVIPILGYPLLYAAIMDYLFVKINTDSQGKKFRKESIWDCKRLYLCATKSKIGGIYIMKFINQVAGLLQEFFSLFNEELYEKDGSTELFNLKHDQLNQVSLDDLSLNIMEMFAHLSFVTDLPVLFNQMILQHKFSLDSTQFNWNILLNEIAKRREKFRDYVEPLIRKTLSKDVRRQFRLQSSYDIRSESLISYVYSKSM